jgi:universal stress protein E
MRSRPDLVVRNVGEPSLANPDVLSEKDWDIVRACPALILLTRGKPWGQHAKLAAAVDTSSDEAPEFAQAILETAQYFTARCAGKLEILSCIPHEASPAEIEAQKHKLFDCANAAGAIVAEQHVCAGEPTRMLPILAVGRSYDAIVLGALTQRQTLSALVGSVTGRMLDALGCDFLLVKPAIYTLPHKEGVRREPVRRAASQELAQ